MRCRLSPLHLIMAVLLIVAIASVNLYISEKTSNFPRHLQGEQETLTNRPVMYTFFEQINSAEHLGPLKQTDQATLYVWRQAWNAAGWDARIISLQDAERHPHYEEYMKKLSQVKLIGGRTSNGRYNELCFLRWLAMGVMPDNNGAGSFMTDYDTLPLKHASSLWPPATTDFTVYEIVDSEGGGLPCLMSGSRAEWTRMAHAILDLSATQKPDNPYHAWSDFLALVALNMKNPVAYRHEDSVTHARPVLINPVSKKTCRHLSRFSAIHFSHRDVRQSKHHIRARPRLEAEFLQSYQQVCGSIYEVPSLF